MYYYIKNIVIKQAVLYYITIVYLMVPSEQAHDRR
jgi:hypothetical protein